MRFGTTAQKPKSVRSERLSEKAAAAAQHAADRKLVEGYWRSVVQSKGEPPLYHTFSDRYGGTRGIPFACRTDCSAVVAVPEPPSVDVEHYMARGRVAIKEGRLEDAQIELQEALTLLQNLHGGLSVADLVKRTDSPQALLQLSEVLRGLAEIAIACRQYENAGNLLHLSCKSNPQKCETYILRASCYERLGMPKEAFDEFEKYLKLNTPSLDVLAQCGKCAAEAGIVSAAESRLRQLLDLAEELENEVALSGGGNTYADKYVYLFPKPSLYIAHANFYLGYIREQQAHSLPSEPAVRSLLRSARPYFAKAVANQDYVEIFERNVGQAIDAKEYDVARELLEHLLMMKPEFAGYYLRLAEVFRMTGNITSEIWALSEALDRHQTLLEQRQTRLARGSIFYEVKDFDSAIMDFSSAIALPCYDDNDYFTPTAYLKRAETYQQRQFLAKNPADALEDQEAALSDYSRFLEAMEKMGGTSVADHSVSHEESRVASANRDFFCDPSSVTSAMLVLANGAFQRSNWVEATKFFSSAIARGWEPIRPSVRKQHSPTVSGSSEAANKNFLEERLYDQMYISLAHTVMAENSVSDDVFKVPYEPRDWIVQQDSKKGKASERKDAEKPGFAFPSLAYVTVDLRYNALRSLEPTMYSALEDMFLELWEPYHNEVERAREDAMNTRGRRGKRHAN